MFPPLTATRRPQKRSFGALVRDAVDTALAFATLGEATSQGFVEEPTAAPASGAPVRRASTAPSIEHPHRRQVVSTPRERRPGRVATCRAMYRRDADLAAGRDPSWAALPRSADDLPAMRVLGAGGGGLRPRTSGRRRCRCGLLHEALRRCLTQRCERQRRVHGVSHQCSEGALLRAAGCGQRGEHVFVNLWPPSDGTRKVRGREPLRKPRFGSAPRL